MRMVGVLWEFAIHGNINIRNAVLLCKVTLVTSVPLGFKPVVIHLDEVSQS